jgi:hypothetical protein
MGRRAPRACECGGADGCGRNAHYRSMLQRTTRVSLPCSVRSAPASALESPVTSLHRSCRVHRGRSAVAAVAGPLYYYYIAPRCNVLRWLRQSRSGAGACWAHSHTHTHAHTHTCCGRVQAAVGFAGRRRAARVRGREPVAVRRSAHGRERKGACASVCVRNGACVGGRVRAGCGLRVCRACGCVCAGRGPWRTRCGGYMRVRGAFMCVRACACSRARVPVCVCVCECAQHAPAPLLL